MNDDGEGEGGGEDATGSRAAAGPLLVGGQEAESLPLSPSQSSLLSINSNEGSERGLIIVKEDGAPTEPIGAGELHLQLTNTSVGAGTLALPYFYASTGLYLGSGILFSIAIMSAISLHILIARAVGCRKLQTPTLVQRR